MAKQRFERVNRPATAAERQRHEEIRAKILQEFPPVEGSSQVITPPGIPTQIRHAREAKGLTWHAVAQLAGLTDSTIVRDLESGRDLQLADVQAVAKALGLRLELVEEKV